MALKPKVSGKAPSAKSPAAKSVASDDAATLITSQPWSSAKLTISVKRRLGNGDEIFIAPGVEMSCTVADLAETQADVTTRVKTWLDDLLEAFPDPTDAEDEAEEADEDESEEADEDESEEGDEEGEDLSEEDIDAMDKKELLALNKEHELGVEGAAKMKLADLREAVKAAAFADDEDESDEAEEADEDEDESEDDGDEGGYDEAELKAMKLEGLQEVCDAWEIKHPVAKKGADLKTKKAAYIKAILAFQEEE